MLCVYCEENEAIENSHIIPKFFYDWMKKTGITQYLRDVSNPNQRLQDGLKVPLLCKVCENNFSKFENKYKSHLFNKIVNYRKEMPEVLTISDSDKLFYLSLVWRQLVNYLIYDDKKNQYPDEISLIARKAQDFKKWMNNIQDFHNNGNIAPIYIIPAKPEILEKLDFLPSETGVWYEYERSIGYDFRFWGEAKMEQIYLYIKLPFQIIVCDLLNNSHDWDMPALHSISELKLCDIKKVPEAIIALSYNRYNTKAKEAYVSLSDKQRENILNDVEKMSDSEIQNTGSYKSMSRHK